MSAKHSERIYGGRGRSKQLPQLVVRGCRGSNGGGYGWPGIRCGMHPQQTAAEGKESWLATVQEHALGVDRLTVFI